METLILNMYKFQKNKGIKDQCVTNTQFLYDCIKHSYKTDVKPRACIVLSLPENKEELRTIIHLVVGVNDTIIDPSYDIASLKPKKYYFDIKTYMEAIKRINVSLDFKKKIIERFMVFLRLAKRIEAGELLVCDEKFYKEQADFIEGLGGEG